jgi:uncharacterized membrane protein YGL010W
MAGRSLQQWFDLYAESHRNSTNKLIHWFCVPVIYFCVLGFMTYIPPVPIGQLGVVRFDRVAIGALLLLFYLPRSLTIMLGMAAWSYGCLWLAQAIGVQGPWPLWSICAVLFVAAWVGQFIGHRIEGRKPSFLDDMRFLLIGPAWLLSFVYKLIGIPY